MANWVNRTTDNLPFDLARADRYHNPMTWPDPHDPFAALRERNYRFFVAGWVPASAGLQMQSAALAWEIYERTNSALALGLAGLARALPTVLFALPAGQIVDRCDRRRVLLVTQVAFAFFSVLLALGSIAWGMGLIGGANEGVWVMYGLIALTGCARALNAPSRSSLLPLIVRGGATGPIFHNAVTWNSGAFQLSAMAGPIAAGLLIASTNQAWPVYAACAAGCLWFAVTCRFIHPFEDQDEPLGDGAASHPMRPPGWIRGMWQLVRPAALLPGILEGVRHVRREKTVLGIMLLDLLAVLLGGATALMPVYARDILHVGPVGFGALRAAPYIGALFMAVGLTHMRPFARTGRVLLAAVAGFGVSTVIFGLSTSLCCPC